MWIGAAGRFDVDEAQPIKRGKATPHLGYDERRLSSADGQFAEILTPGSTKQGCQCKQTYARSEFPTVVARQVTELNRCRGEARNRRFGQARAPRELCGSEPKGVRPISFDQRQAARECRREPE